MTTHKPSRRDELAKEYGLKVAKHSYERGPMRNIDGSPREFNNRPDFQTESAFQFGYDSAVEDMQKQVDIRDAVISKMRLGLERLTKCGPPSKPCSGDEIFHVLMVDNCNLASECLAEVDKMLGSA